eukprot:11219416-Lingulodinium_polyedra.AAC.5
MAETPAHKRRCWADLHRRANRVAMPGVFGSMPGAEASPGAGAAVPTSGAVAGSEVDSAVATT